MNKMEEQKHLTLLCFYNGAIDGIHGPKTETAKLEFLENAGVDESRYFEQLERGLAQLKGILSRYKRPDDLADVVKQACIFLGYNDVRLWSYMMATVQHETGGALWPIEECGHIKDTGQRQRLQRGLAYYPHFGRGLAQLTHLFNYERWSAIFGVDFVNDPDQLLKPLYSAAILIVGSIQGMFTGRALPMYINQYHCDYIQARRVINGVRQGETLPDRAEKIASYAKEWEVYYG